MASNPKIDLVEAKSTPERVFDSPEAVISVSGLSLLDKKEILESWKQNAQQLLRAQVEGMAGGEPNQLHAIQRAIDELETT